MNRKLAIITISLTLGAAAVGFAFNLGISQLLSVPEGAMPLTIADDKEPVTDRSSLNRRSGSRATSGAQYIRDILHRNIFDHTKVGVTANGSTGPESQTDLDYKLVLTLVASPESFSSALIAPKDGESSAHGYGIGHKLEDATIISIEQRLIKLKRADGQVEVLAMEEETSGSRRTPSGKALSDDEGIEKVGENSYVVDQSIIDKYLGNLDALSKMARASPHRGPDGEIDGYRLSGVRRNTPLDKLGIKNGDVIKGVNSQPLNSISNAMGAYSSMQQESKFTFEVARRGQDLTLNFEIR